MAEVVDLVLAGVSNPYLRQQGQQEGPESPELIEYDFQRQYFYGDDFRFNLWRWEWGESLEQELEIDEITTALNYDLWARRVKVDPFVNVSSIRVPPSEEPRKPTVDLWIGTSILKAIDEEKVGAETGAVVEK